MEHLVIAPLLLPLLAGITLLLMRGSATPTRQAVSTTATFALVVIAVLLLLRVADGSVLVYSLGDWPAPFGIVLVADRLSAIISA